MAPLGRVDAVEDGAGGGVDHRQRRLELVSRVLQELAACLVGELELAGHRVEGPAQLAELVAALRQAGSSTKIATGHVSGGLLQASERADQRAGRKEAQQRGGYRRPGGSQKQAQDGGLLGLSGRRSARGVGRGWDLGHGCARASRVLVVRKGGRSGARCHRLAGFVLVHVGKALGNDRWCREGDDRSRGQGNESEAECYPPAQAHIPLRALRPPPAAGRLYSRRLGPSRRTNHRRAGGPAWPAGS